jgi:hypothetical protein
LCISLACYDYQPVGKCRRSGNSRETLLNRRSPSLQCGSNVPDDLVDLNTVQLRLIRNTMDSTTTIIIVRHQQISDCS